MHRTVRHLVQVACLSLFLTFTTATAALAGPAPIEPEFPPPSGGGTTDASSGSEFPWLLAGATVVLAITTVVLAAVLWQRTHTGRRHGLVTP